MNPDLKDPVNAVGTMLAIVGGIGMMGLLFSVPDWIQISGIILWVAGIILLITHSTVKR